MGNLEAESVTIEFLKFLIVSSNLIYHPEGSQLIIGFRDFMVDDFTECLVYCIAFTLSCMIILHGLVIIMDVFVYVPHGKTAGLVADFLVLLISSFSCPRNPSNGDPLF